MYWVDRVEAQTEARPSTAPTDRSIPPDVMTNVMPMLTTPVTAARLRMVVRLPRLTNRSPAGHRAHDDQEDQGEHEATHSQGWAHEGPIVALTRHFLP